MTAITISDLRFAYGRKVIYSGFSLALTEFPVLLLGPNGAGKTTLLKLIGGQLAPRQGTVSLSGQERRGIRTIGWLPQRSVAISGMTVHDQVAYAGWLAGMPSGDAGRGATAAIESVGLGGKLRDRVRSLSGGELRRVGVAEALVSSPQAVLMDEPFANLDPDQRGSLRDLLTSLRDRVGIVVSSHQLDDITEVYRTVVVVDRGAVRFQGTPQEFLALAGSEFDGPLRAESAYRAALASSPA